MEKWWHTPTIAELRAGVIGAIIALVFQVGLNYLELLPGGGNGGLQPVLSIAGLAAVLVALLWGVRRFVATPMAEGIQFALVITWMQLMSKVIK